MLLQIDEWSLHNVYLDPDTGEWLVPLREDHNARILRFDPVALELSGAEDHDIPAHVLEWLEQWLTEQASRWAQARFGGEPALETG